MVKKFRIFLFLVVVAAFSGCGYTTRSMLPAHIKTVHVAPVANAIDLSSEISDRERLRLYRPGLEVDLTNAMINRFIFDGNLKVVSEDKANLIVKAKLVDFRRDPLRYTADDDIQEYRLSVVMDVSVYEAGDHRVLWHEKNLTGDTTFFLSGPSAQSEDETAVKVVDDAARRVVENTMELW